MVPPSRCGPEADAGEHQVGEALDSGVARRRRVEHHVAVRLYEHLERLSAWAARVAVQVGGSEHDGRSFGSIVHGERADAGLGGAAPRVEPGVARHHDLAVVASEADRVGREPGRVERERQPERRLLQLVTAALARRTLRPSRALRAGVALWPALTLDALRPRPSGPASPGGPWILPTLFQPEGADDCDTKT